MALAAIDCVRRGMRNARANRELILVRWLASLGFGALLVAGAAPIFLVLGFSVSDLPSRPEGWETFGAELVSRLSGAWGPLLAAGLAAVCVWTFAFIGMCFVQAGTYGVLYAGDRQAPSGLPGQKSWFRTYSGADFSGWGGLLMWRFFWFANLYACLLLGVVAVLLLLMIAAGLAAETWGWPAGIGIGCGGALPLLFLMVVLGLWYEVAQADLARDGAGVGRSSRLGLRVLGRRLGGVLLIVLLAVMAATAVAIVFAPFTILIDVALGDGMAVHLSARALVFAAQSLASSALSIVVGGSFVALVRDASQGAA